MQNAHFLMRELYQIKTTNDSDSNTFCNDYEVAEFFYFLFFCIYLEVTFEPGSIIQIKRIFIFFPITHNGIF